LPVDGGSVTIAVRAPGYESWSMTRTIKGERDAQTVVVPRLAELRSPPVAPDAGRPPPPVVSRSDVPAPPVASRSHVPAPPDAPAAVEPRADHPTGPSLVAPIALGVAAVVFGGTGLGFELRSESTYDKAKTTNQQGLLALASSYRDSAVRDRYIAQGLA